MSCHISLISLAKPIELAIWTLVPLRRVTWLGFDSSTATAGAAA